ncbi:hypothetical protein [uncultured Thiodictyon sp.]|uniref:hypothetical protein n=1 Tax=uncultured Thiodictyon sp. TaxID=1846217 RepID=UPI0025D91F5D|nr:hypothetical protein [uncultured Thiodictyon sp.]
MNETLAAMAQALFKDWFVDFGPTRAKQEGLEPYLTPELWSLFPERLDAEGTSEGWRRCALEDIVDVNPTEPLKKGTAAPYLEMSALPTRGSITEPAVLREFTWGMRFRNGDTLFARITPCLENGKTAFVQSLIDVWSAFGAIIEPLFQRIRANGEESRTLAQTRDLLLPKLMSGEIRVKDAERTIEDLT